MDAILDFMVKLMLCCGAAFVIGMMIVAFIAVVVSCFSGTDDVAEDFKKIKLGSN